VVFSVALFADPDFGGCSRGGEIAEPPRDLPRSTEPECSSDFDCETDSCTVATCLGRRCIPTDEPIDSDGDGRSPIPCGDDCDDRDPTVRPGAGEVCDHVDNDCNGRIDEAMTPLVTVTRVYDASSQAVILPWGERALLLYVDFDGVLRAIEITPGLAPATRALTVPFFTRPTSLQAAAGPGDRHFVSYNESERTRYTIITRGAGGEIELVEGPSALFAAEDAARSYRAVAFEASFAVLYDGFDPETAAFARILRTTPTGDSITTVVSDVALAPMLASDGTHLAFLDPGSSDLFFVDRDGVLVARHTIEPNLNAFSGLASGDGVVFALTRRVGGEIAAVHATSGVIEIARLRASYLFSAGERLVTVATDGAFPWRIEVIDDASGLQFGSVLLPTDTSQIYSLGAAPIPNGVAVAAGLESSVDIGIVSVCPPR
jgi:hypothetical protein